MRTFTWWRAILPLSPQSIAYLLRERRVRMKKTVCLAFTFIIAALILTTCNTQPVTTCYAPHILTTQQLYSIPTLETD